MRAITREAAGVWCGVCMLMVLGASTALAGRSNQRAALEKSDLMSREVERRRFPEISYLRGRAVARNTSARERELAHRVIERWDNGLVDPEPIVVDAWLERGRRDEYTGRMIYGLLEGLPQDPFSDGDFQYERTNDGFVLRFDPDRLADIRVREFEFAVPKE